MRIDYDPRHDWYWTRDDNDRTISSASFTVESAIAKLRDLYPGKNVLILSAVVQIGESDNID